MQQNPALLQELDESQQTSLPTVNPWIAWPPQNPPGPLQHFPLLHWKDSWEGQQSLSLLQPFEPASRQQEDAPPLSGALHPLQPGAGPAYPGGRWLLL